MSAHAHDVLTACLAVLRADLGSLDLSSVSSTHRVIIADTGLRTPTPPMLMLSAPSVRTVPDGGGAMGEYLVQGRIEWWLVVPSATATPEGRVYAALDGASEVIAALELGHQGGNATLGALLRLVPSLLDAVGAGGDVPAGCGLAYGEILYEHILATGV